MIVAQTNHLLDCDTQPDKSARKQFPSLVPPTYGHFIQIGMRSTRSFW